MRGDEARTVSFEDANTKIAAVFALAADMSASQDEYAVGLAADVLAVIDGDVTSEQIMGQVWAIRSLDTVGDALISAKKLNVIDRIARGE
jgi:hypothetical protein